MKEDQLKKSAEMVQDIFLNTPLDPEGRLRAIMPLEWRCLADPQEKPRLLACVRWEAILRILKDGYHLGNPIIQQKHTKTIVSRGYLIYLEWEMGLSRIIQFPSISSTKSMKHFRGTWEHAHLWTKLTSPDSRITWFEEENLWETSNNTGNETISMWEDLQQSNLK